MNKEKIKKSLDILQRMLDNGHIKSFDGDDQYESGYGSCLKDIAFIMLGSDDGYGTE